MKRIPAPPHPKDRPFHPEFGHALGGHGYEIDGVLFRPYRTGIAPSSHYSDDFQIEIREVGGRGGTYTVTVDGVRMAKKARSFEQAARNGIKARKEEQAK